MPIYIYIYVHIIISYYAPLQPCLEHQLEKISHEFEPVEFSPDKVGTLLLINFGQFNLRILIFFDLAYGLANLKQSSEQTLKIKSARTANEREDSSVSNSSTQKYFINRLSRRNYKPFSFIKPLNLIYLVSISQ